jgi:RNA polymerase sigma-70 factor (ECF subfamily)
VVQDVEVGEETGTSLEDVFRTEGPRMWRALVGCTADPEIASDALAEAFAQALARGAQLRSPDRWIWRAAFRIAAGELKRRSKVEADPAERTEEMTETVQDIVSALRKLSPNQRAAVVLHDYAGYRSTEVASILGMSAATVRVYLSTGRRRLRHLLEDYR